eukprot:gene13744-15958_t
MFQYAAARALLSDESPVYFDLSFLRENATGHIDFTAREFQLTLFPGLKAKLAAGNKINLWKSETFYYRILRSYYKRHMIYIVQRSNEFVSLPPVSKNNMVYLDGYFQSEKYFLNSKHDLLHEFEFPELDDRNALIKKKIQSSGNTVSLHIRRGDYLHSEAINAIHGVLPYSYYSEAISNLAAIYGELKIFVFSEDIDWAKSHFWGNNYHFLAHNKGNDSWKDMALMSACKHHVIANSSFSWWGAWLSKDIGSVIAPSKWFNPQKVQFDIHHIIPDNWTILHVE